MAEFTQEEVAEFRSLVGLAESGEMQAAVDTFGPIRINPYYYDNPRMANIVGYFMNNVVPVAQNRHEQDDATFSMSDVIAASVSPPEFSLLGKTLALADESGFLYKVTDDEPSILANEYRLTRSGHEVEPAKVHITLHSRPERSGKFTGFVTGALSTVLLATQIDPDEVLKPYFVAGGGFYTLIVGDIIGERTGRVVAGREAYRYYQLQSDQTNL